MRCAIVGCGYVAGQYLRSIRHHPELDLLGATDRDADRMERLASWSGIRPYSDLCELIEDPRVDIVINLTSVPSHADVTIAALAAGKHVYSEKPLATDLATVRRMERVARANGATLASAPCLPLAPWCQSASRLIASGAIGRPRLAYAELDDGALHRMGHARWRQPHGVPWPAADEFRAGCVLEHAGYGVAALCSLLGPASGVTAASGTLVPTKLAGVPPEETGTDFSIAAIEFRLGAVARLTTSTLAPRDRSLKVFGDEGVIKVADCWDYASPVTLQGVVPWTDDAPHVYLGDPRAVRYGGYDATALGVDPSHRMDFALGVSELAASVREGRPCRLGPAFSNHVLEIVLAIEAARRTPGVTRLTTSFDDDRSPRRDLPPPGGDGRTEEAVSW